MKDELLELISNSIAIEDLEEKEFRVELLDVMTEPHLNRLYDILTREKKSREFRNIV